MKKRQRKREAKRIEPGDGRPLKRFRWWQLPGRALFYFGNAHAIDVRHWQNQSSGDVKARHYVHGRLYAESKMPAVFPIDGGSIEVAMSNFGMKRCHFVAPDGTEQALTPDTLSAEGRRARFERRHPTASHAVGLLSVIMLLIGLALLAQTIAVPLLQMPPVAERIGHVEPLVVLPLWLTIAVTVATITAATERATRLRYHWFLDAAGS